MTDFDLDRLGDVWRQEPDPAEMAALRRTAELVARRARTAQIADAALAIVVSGVVLMLALSNPEPATLIVGGAAIALMLYSSVRQRRLRKLELASLSGTAEEMLDQSIARIRATVKRARLGLISAVPGILVGVGFGAALDSGGGSGLAARYSANPFAIVITAGIFAITLAGFVYYLRAMRRDQSELERLITLRQSFTSERENNTL